MKFAYADPPYLGCASFYRDMHPDWEIWNKPEAHRDLVAHLVENYPDGWALSLHEPSLRTIHAMCPDGVRVMPWIKPFCSFKPGVGVAYAWEPVIVWGGRKRTREQETVRDWVAANITLQRGLTGAKPAQFVMWLLDVLNAQVGDEFDDLFPGNGAVRDIVNQKLRILPPDQLFVGHTPAEVAA